MVSLERSDVAPSLRSAPVVVQSLRAVSPGHPLQWSTPSGARSPALPATSGANGSQCDPYWPAAMPIGLAPINGTVTWTGNTSGAGPLNVSWSIVIGGGGIPPYQSTVEFEPFVGGNFTWNSTNLSGTVSLTTPGMYVGVAEVVDSTCDAIGGFFFGPVTVYGPSGLDPVEIATSSTGGPAPLNVSYSLNVSRVGPNETMLWESPFSYDSSGWTVNATYYTAGNYSAVGCLLDPATGAWLACGNSSGVVVTGSVVTTAASVGNGTLPVNITYWVNVTNTTALPASWTVDLWTDNGTLLQVSSQNASTSVTGSFGCGPSFGTKPPNAAGRCTWVASYLITADPGGTPEFVAKGTIWANLSEYGSPVLWYPTVAFTESPTNGSAPLNVTVNVSASNGLAPYQYWWALFGASSALPNQTYYPTTSGNGSGWNGSALSLPFRLNRTGIYMIALTVRDLNENPVFLYPPVIPVGVALAPGPLHLSAAETAGASSGPGTSEVAFVANVSGGEGPYTVQWAFGDGTFGASLPGAPVRHTYETAGTFVPTVAVTDRAGTNESLTLPPVVVAGSPRPISNQSSHGTTGPAPGSGRGGVSGWLRVPNIGWVNGILLIAALGLVGLVAFRAERERAAEKFVRRLEADATPEAPPPPLR
jgi:hypothetical protein